MDISSTFFFIVVVVEPLLIIYYDTNICFFFVPFFRNNDVILNLCRSINFRDLHDNIDSIIACVIVDIRIASNQREREMMELICIDEMTSR